MNKAQKAGKQGPGPDRLAYSVKDAAALIGVSHHLLYAAIREGKLVPKRLGTRTLIPADRLRAFLDSLEDATPLPSPNSRR